MAIGFAPSLAAARVLPNRDNILRLQSCPSRSRRSVFATKPLSCVASSEIKEGHDSRLVADGHELSYSYFNGDSPTIVFLPSFFFSRWRQVGSLYFDSLLFLLFC